MENFSAVTCLLYDIPGGGMGCSTVGLPWLLLVGGDFSAVTCLLYDIPGGVMGCGEFS